MPFDPEHPYDWILRKVAADLGLADENLLALMRGLCRSLYCENVLVSTPKFAALLWPGCTRESHPIDPGPQREGEDDIDYDERIRQALLEQSVLDFRFSPNDPRLKALLKEYGARVTGHLASPCRHAHELTHELTFKYAGGSIPKTVEGVSWSLHHIYDTQLRLERLETQTDAPNDGRHFTQSAGLVAVHPVIESLYTLLLRGENTARPCVRGASVRS